LIRSPLEWVETRLTWPSVLRAKGTRWKGLALVQASGYSTGEAVSPERLPMLQAYIRGALGRAHYEILEDDGSYYGEIPDFEGVFANAGLAGEVP
jgi:hypothetical protein